jgi:electron transfer flavoprotein beta subunit
VASAIAKSVSQKSYSLYLAGVMSADLNQGLVGPMLAELLSLPIATAVVERRLSEDLRTVTVQRELEGGLREILEMSLPAVLTIQSGINKPRYPTLSNMFRAKKQTLETIDLSNQPTSGLRQELIRLRSPEKTRQGLLLEGTQKEKARQLIEILQAKALL